MQLSEYEIQGVLSTAQTIAVIGLSDNPARDSNGVARFLQRHGYTIVPINPNLHEVLGERAYPSLHEVPVPIDIVNVFRKSEFVPAIVDEAIGGRAKMVWLQLGVIHEAAATKAAASGLGVVMDRCIAIEHRRLMRMSPMRV
ncbi:CoA-binding protein [Candidatus Gracilibacteria bacterium]|nr:CoA-binding protein [Candidatus Gracilibacteria bacterium]